MATNEQPDGILLALLRYGLNIISILGGILLVVVMLFILITQAKPEPAVEVGEQPIAQTQAAPTTTAAAPATEAPAPATEAPAPTTDSPAAADPAVISMGEELFTSQGCVACHTIEGVSQGMVGPNLTNIGATAGERATESGVADAEAYIRESIVDTNAFIAPECPAGPCQPGLMPATFGETLSEEQINALVEYLLAQKGDG